MANTLKINTIHIKQSLNALGINDKQDMNFILSAANRKIKSWEIEGAKEVEKLDSTLEKTIQKLNLAIENAKEQHANELENTRNKIIEKGLKEILDYFSFELHQSNSNLG